MPAFENDRADAGIHLRGPRLVVANDLLQEGRSESTPEDLLTRADPSTGAVVGLEAASFWFGDLCSRRR
jgi:hypothetical protein